MNEVMSSQDLVFVDQNEIYTDSLIVAREFKRLHKNVLQDIKKLMTQLADIPNGLKFELVEYIDKKGEKRPKYNLSKDALTILVMGYSTKRAMEIKIKYIQEFNRMQRYIHQKQQFISDMKFPITKLLQCLRGRLLFHPTHKILNLQQTTKLDFAKIQVR